MCANLEKGSLGVGGGLTVGGDILVVGSPPLEAAAKGSNLGFGIGLSNASTGPEAKMSSALGLEDFSLLYFLHVWCTHWST